MRHLVLICALALPAVTIGQSPVRVTDEVAGLDAIVRTLISAFDQAIAK